MADHVNHLSLVGTAVSAIIGEPWDFRSSVGEGHTIGKILAVSPLESPREWIRVAIEPFFENGIRISEVLAVGRYSKVGIVESLLVKGAVGLNLLFYVNGAPIEYKDISDHKIKDGQMSFLVGSLKLARKSKDVTGRATFDNSP